MRLFKDREMESRVKRLEELVELLEGRLEESENRQSIDGGVGWIGSRIDLRQYFPAKEILRRFNEIYDALKMERVTEPQKDAVTQLVKKK